MSLSHEDKRALTELADEAVAHHGSLTPEERKTLQEFSVEMTDSMRDAAGSQLGSIAVRGRAEFTTSFAVHSGYKNGRRA